MDGLLKEGYNALKHSSEYGYNRWLKMRYEEPIAESIARVFLSERSPIFEYIERRLVDD